MTGTAIGHLIEIAFKGNRKEFFLWEGEQPPPAGTQVLVEADRGEDLGRVHSVGDVAAHRCGGCSHGSASERPEKRALRVATAQDIKRLEELRSEDEAARRKAIEKVRAHALVMKISDAEWQWDRRKLTLYFTAEKRVDFRALVRDLASTFRARIELKQIGVRDEAKRLDGVGRCGRQYCSASWLPELRPVNLQVAKDQRLSLNPSQISGACGRLMCCLRYEHEFYVQARKRFPKEGRLLVTSQGEEKVLANDIFSERVTLLGAEGETRVVKLGDLRRELESLGSSPTHRGGGASEDRTQRELSDNDDASPVDSPARPPASTADGAPIAEGGGEDEEPRRRPRRRGRRGGRRGRGGGAAENSRDDGAA